MPRQGPEDSHTRGGGGEGAFPIERAGLLQLDNGVYWLWYIPANTKSIMLICCQCHIFNLQFYNVQNEKRCMIVPNEF